MQSSEPTRPTNPTRNFRIPDHEYGPAMVKAKAAKVSLTSVVRAAIREWVQR